MKKAMKMTGGSGQKMMGKKAPAGPTGKAPRKIPGVPPMNGKKIGN